MHDELDTPLAQRLRGHESGPPHHADARDPSSPRRSRFAWPAALTLGAAAVAVVALVAVMLGRPLESVGEAPASASPTSSGPTPLVASASHVVSPTESPTPPPSPTATESAPSTSLRWTATASFDGDGGPSMVNDVAVGSSHVVAVGVAYRSALPGVGPLPPHRARIWTSADGRSWSEVDLGPAAANVRLEHVVVRADGSFLALGTRSVADADGRVTGDSGPVAWSSIDGHEWADASVPFATSPSAVAQGSAGYLAASRGTAALGSRVWHSLDGVSWTLAIESGVDLADLEAGIEGFAGVGRDPRDGGVTLFASADGREWFTAADPPPGVVQVAPLGSDWLAISALSDTVPTGALWFSANGLEWREHGAIGLTEPDVASAPGQCGEYPREMSAAGSWLVVSTELSYPCSEGGFAVHARQWISSDGSAWAQLPFEPGTPGDARSGADVTDAAELDGSLILVGEEDGRAAFWFGEAP